MAGVTSGLGGFVSTNLGEGLLPDFSLLWTDHSAHGDDFAFLSFFQMIYLGDARMLISRSPRGSGTQFQLDEDIISNSQNQQALLGDPVKNTMFLQIFRSLPIISTIPLVVTMVLVMFDLFKLAMPIKKTIIEATQLAPYIAPFTGNRRKRRSIACAEQVKGRNRLTSTITSLTRTVYWALENKETELEKQEGYFWGNQNQRRNTSLYGDREGFLSEGSLAQNDLALLVRDGLSVSTGFIHELGICIGHAVGCHLGQMLRGSQCEEQYGLVQCSAIVSEGFRNALTLLPQ